MEMKLRRRRGEEPEGEGEDEDTGRGGGRKEGIRKEGKVRCSEMSLCVVLPSSAGSSNGDRGQCLAHCGGGHCGEAYTRGWYLWLCSSE